MDTTRLDSTRLDSRLVLALAARVTSKTGPAWFVVEPWARLRELKHANIAIMLLMIDELWCHRGLEARFIGICGNVLDTKLRNRPPSPPPTPET